MIREGILHVIGDIIVNETEPLVLVCLLLFIYLFFSFYKKVTLLLSSTIVVEWGLDTKQREEITRDTIGSILKIVMVCFL